MRIVGIDPGLGITGYGIIDVTAKGFSLVDAGVIKTSAKRDMQYRLATLHKEISFLMEKSKPKVCVLEDLYSHYKHPRTSILMGHARGVICLGCAINLVELVNVPAKRIKKAVCGHGNATKEQVKQMVCHKLQLVGAPRYNDITDALALAIGYAQMEQVVGSKI